LVPRQSGKKDGEWTENEFLESSEGETPLYLKYPRLLQYQKEAAEEEEVNGLHKLIVNDNLYMAAEFICFGG